MGELANSRGLRGWVGLCAAVLMIVGCAIPNERPPSDRPTIVSLNPCLDAILVEVAQPEQILALSHYSSDPASTSMEIERANQFAKTGGTAEEILALSPDIVLASTFIAPATRSALERAGLRIETFGSASSLEQSIEQIRNLTDLVKGGEAGEALVKSLEVDLGPEPKSQISALLWQPGQIVPGEATLIAQHLEWARLSNHAAAMGLDQADHVTLEAILANPPQILLIAGDSTGQTHPLLNQLDNTLVAPYPPSLLYCAGPTIPKARAHLAAIRSEYERDFKRGTGE